MDDDINDFLETIKVRNESDRFCPACIASSRESVAAFRALAGVLERLSDYWVRERQQEQLCVLCATPLKGRFG